MFEFAEAGPVRPKAKQRSLYEEPPLAAAIAGTAAGPCRRRRAVAVSGIHNGIPAFPTNSSSWTRNEYSDDLSRRHDCYDEVHS
jgi:hypothetical protein